MSEDFDKIYDDRYFKWHLKYAREYAIRNMNWFIDEYNISSLIDFGCGLGSYLESAYSKQLKIKGYEYANEYAKKYTTPSIIEYIEYGVDCTQFIDIDFKYDCAISIEVGEHLDGSKSDMFCENISRSLDNGGILIFSAAQPNQGGSGHINCQEKQFWIDIFSELGFKNNKKRYENIKKMWGNMNTPNYILNNFFTMDKTYE